MLDDYLSEFGEQEVSWLDVAAFYTYLGHFDEAEEMFRIYRDNNPNYRNAAAQEYSFAERLGYSAELMAEGFGEDHSFLTLDFRLRFALSPSFSVFVPFDGSELLYDKRGAKHYDFAVKSGLGVRVNHGLRSNGELAASLAGLSTIGEADGNYWHIRLMGEYVMPALSRYRSIMGVGVEYLAPYGPSSRIGGFYLVVSMGIFL